MPNIPANRINNKYNFENQGFTLSGGEESWSHSLNYAITAIQKGEMESAIVGAIDITHDEYPPEADDEKIANAAIIWVLCNTKTAHKENFKILAELDISASETSITEPENPRHPLDILYKRLGKNTLIQTALEASYTLWQKQGLAIDAETPLTRNNTKPFLITPQIQATLNTAAPNLLTRQSISPGLALFAADDKAQLIEQINNERYAEDATQHPHRAGFYFNNSEEYNEQINHLLQHLESDNASAIHNPTFCYSPQILEGEITLMFTGAASAYPGAAQALLSEFPLLIQNMQKTFAGEVEDYCGWMYPQWGESQIKNGPYNDLRGSSFVCQLHATICLQGWGLKPNAIFGLSSGETNSIAALGFWKNLPDQFNDMWGSNLYQTELAGSYNTVKRFWNQDSETPINWVNWILFGDSKEVKAALEGEEQVYLTIISSPKECVIAGEATACQRILKKLSHILHNPLKHELACHAPELGDFEPIWKKFHTRKVYQTKQNKNLKVYSNFFGGLYTPTQANVAETLTSQASTTLDFPMIARKVYDDGARIFIEQGPRDSLANSLKAILNEAELHKCLIISMDQFSQNAVDTLWQNTLKLWCSGQKINLNGCNLQNH
ncbi:MAG: hypothetical protein GY727_03185, partial [Gammaproteobacteria bacterium]|nr:hypothetical protein [Gammaproteobacteria bacterium]